MPKSTKSLPIYQYDKKVNGQTRYYIRPFVNGTQLTKRVDDYGNMWLGKEGYDEAVKYYKKLIEKKSFSNDINNMTIYDVANEYLDNLQDNVKKRTYRDYNSIINLHILPFFKVKNTYLKFMLIDNSTIIKWHKYLIEKKCDIEYKQKIHCVFSYIFNYAMKIYNINNNPLKNVGNFKKKKGQVKEKDFLTEAEFYIVYNNIKGRVYQNFFKVMFFTGTRIGELCDIKLKNIDFKNKTIHVENTLWQHAKSLDDLEEGAKTDTSVRDIPIIDEIFPIIVEQYNKTLNEYNNMDAYLFSREKKTCRNGRTFLAETTIREHLKYAKSFLSGDREITPHSLRHSFITICAKRGIDVRIVAKIVGHKDIMTTYRIYTHVSKDEINNFNSLFYRKATN